MEPPLTHHWRTHAHLRPHHPAHPRPLGTRHRPLASALDRRRTPHKSAHSEILSRRERLAPRLPALHVPLLADLLPGVGDRRPRPPGREGHPGHLLETAAGDPG